MVIKGLDNPVYVMFGLQSYFKANGLVVSLTYLTQSSIASKHFNAAASMFRVSKTVNFALETIGYIEVRVSIQGDFSSVCFHSKESFKKDPTLPLLKIHIDDYKKQFETEPMDTLNSLYKTMLDTIKENCKI